MSLVLVVDHAEAARVLLCNVLEDEGFETDSAGDSAEAVCKIVAQRPDLMLLDLQLPGVDGWGLLQHLRGTADPPPVVLLSEPFEFSSFARGVRAGVLGFVPRPVSLRNLVSTCRRALASGGVEAAALDESERRGEKRRPLLIGVRVLSSEEVPGELVNLSPSGAQIILVASFEPGTRLQVTLEPSLIGELVEFEAEVRWRVPCPTGFTHGLSMVNLPASVAERIRGLLDAPS